jgi:aspartate/methionine/tyrosine aminotransferase
MVRDLRQRVDYCFGVLSELDSVTVHRPEGAFYLFPGIAGLEDSFSFCVSLSRIRSPFACPFSRIKRSLLLPGPPSGREVRDR